MALARQQLVEHSLQATGMTPEQIERLTPLAAMRLVMAARLKVGDHAGALTARLLHDEGDDATLPA